MMNMMMKRCLQQLISTDVELNFGTVQRTRRLELLKLSWLQRNKTRGLLEEENEGVTWIKKRR